MRYIPTHVQIETVNRFCDARCPMCTIKFVPDWEKTSVDEFSFRGVSRPAEIMTLDTFKAIAEKFRPYTDSIHYLSLHGCGEPLLDKTLSEKVAVAKDVGFKQIGFTSNCGNLTEKFATKLLDAGLNCLIPSIDGIEKSTHEEIRPRTNYEKIVENVIRFIKLRDEGGYRCSVRVRMVRQQLNINQWDAYQEFWNSYLSPEKGDKVVSFDVHNTGGKVPDYENKKISNYETKIDAFNNALQSSSKNCQSMLNETASRNDGVIALPASDFENHALCPDLFSRLSIFASGRVALCSADQAEYFDIGGLLEDGPVEIFNGPVFERYREKWLSQKYIELDHCKDCTIAISRFHKT